MARAQPRPIRIFYSTLPERFYATRAWREVSPGIVKVTGERNDVTDDISGLIRQHGIEFRSREDHLTGNGQ